MNDDEEEYERNFKEVSKFRKKTAKDLANVQKKAAEDLVDVQKKSVLIQMAMDTTLFPQSYLTDGKKENTKYQLYTEILKLHQ